MINEERVKWIMEQTHKYELTYELEQVFGYENIESFISDLNADILNIEQMELEKPWIQSEEDKEIEKLLLKPEDYLKYQQSLSKEDKAILKKIK